MSQAEEANERERSFYRCSPRYFERVRGERFGRSDREIESISVNCASVCNYACEKCLARDAQNNARDTARFLRDAEMPVGEVRELLAEARACGARYVEIQSSGEPLAPANREFVFNVVRAAHDCGLPLSVLTNGSLLDEAAARFLAEHDADVLVSLDYLDARAYARRSGTGNESLLARVLANVETLRRVYAPLDFEERRSWERRGGVQGGARGEARVLRAGIHATLANDNAEQMPLLRRLAGDSLHLAIDSIADFGAARCSGLARGVENFSEPLVELSDESIILSSSSVAERGFETCGAFYYGISVDFDGVVVLDAHLLETRGLMASLGETACESGFREAARFSRRAARAFYEETGSQCFCPMRDRVNYARFLAWLRRNST
jgi:hypothetical protein